MNKKKRKDRNHKKDQVRYVIRGMCARENFRRGRVESGGKKKENFKIWCNDFVTFHLRKISIFFFS